MIRKSSSLGCWLNHLRISSLRLIIVLFSGSVFKRVISIPRFLNMDIHSRIVKFDLWDVVSIMVTLLEINFLSACVAAPLNAGNPHPAFQDFSNFLLEPLLHLCPRRSTYHGKMMSYFSISISVSSEISLMLHLVH